MSIEQLSQETFKALEHFRLNFWKDFLKNNKDYIKSKIDMEDFGIIRSNPIWLYRVITLNNKLHCPYLNSISYIAFEGYLIANGALINETQYAKEIAEKNNYWHAQAINLLK